MPAIDQALLRRLRLHRRPRGQVVFANLVLAPDYRFPRRTHISLEGAAQIPTNGGAILAMNHTDRFNYWPFQYRMYRAGLPFTATWVKGKYYESAAMTWFLSQTNNIPLPSRGYLLTTKFRSAHGRVPDEREYRYLRDLTNEGACDRPPPSPEIASMLQPDAAAFVDAFEAEFDGLMREVMDLTRRALTELGLNLLVFPEGTRSKTLAPGHTGLMEVSQYLGLPVIPVGCSGSDKLYPGNSPLSKGGRVTYRVGAPMSVDGPELGPYRITDDAVPFSPAMKARHGDALRTMTDIMMAKINALVDPVYRSSNDGPAPASDGTNRFV